MLQNIKRSTSGFNEGLKEELTMRKSVKNTIWLSWEAYMFLHRKDYRDSTGKELSERAIRYREIPFESLQRNGYYQATDYYLSNWSCQDMARILDEAGLDYRMGEPVEVIEISL